MPGSLAQYAREQQPKTSYNGGHYIYQNPMLKPSSALKSFVPNPVISTDDFESEHTNWDFFKKSELDTDTFVVYSHSVKKSDGWNTFLDHSKFIETMLNHIRDEAAARLIRLDDHFQSPLKVESSKSNELLIPKQLDRISQRFSKARKLEVPWQNTSAFASPSALRAQTFSNFAKMCPDPPRTPEKHDEKASDLPKRKKSELSDSRADHTVIAKMELVPLEKFIPDYSKSSKYDGPKRTFEELMDEIAKNRKQKYLEKAKTKESSPKMPGVKYPNQFTVKPPAQLFHPLPLSKRREYFPHNQPTLYHALYYGTGKRDSGTRIMKPSKPALRKPRYVPMRTGITVNGQKVVVLAKVEKSKQKQKEQMKPGNGQIHPAMLFPFHVPGPKHDNIYISKYHGSDSDSEPDTSNKESDYDP